MEPNHVVFDFDHHYLNEHDNVLDQLSELYCKVFSLDEKFGEYRQCPICKCYFNFHQVEEQGITTCSHGHEEVDLVLAWDPICVKDEILEQSSESGFKGVLAIHDSCVIGFAWARLLSFEEVRKHWKGEVIDEIQPISRYDSLVYFDELGVDPDKRCKGLGNYMVQQITKWARENFPDHMALLRTHQDSHARPLFEKAGFVKFNDDTEFGDGRIMMKADRCENLN